MLLLHGATIFTQRLEMRETSSSKLFAELYGSLRRVRAKWKQIGALLGLPKWDLDAIEKDCLHDTDACLQGCLNLWLCNLKDKEKSNELVALALLKVDEPALAADIYPPVKKNWMYTASKLKYQINLSAAIGVCICLLCLLVGTWNNYFWTKNPDISQPVTPGVSHSLPLLKEKLLGRDKEVKLILDYLDHQDVEVVTLFGSPGFGKSAIAKHVGHTVLQAGMDVHYLAVEDFADVNALIEELIKISRVTETVSFVSWVKNITRKTLVILDNVDGYNWIQEHSRKAFQKHFLSVLQDHSSNLNVLITSQREIHSQTRYRSHQLLSLDTDSCAKLLNYSVSEMEVSFSYARIICDLIGGVPLAIKVIGATLSPPVNYPVDKAIERLNDTLMLSFIAEKGELTSEDRILSALQLGFEHVKKEHQICALLSARFTGSFTLAIIKKILTVDLMQSFASHFHTEDCFYELNMKSFIEVISYIDANRPKKYHYHVLVKNFLESSISEFNISTALDAFWMNYLNWLSSEDGEEWLIANLAKEDLEILIRESRRRSDHSYYLAVSITSNRLFVNYINGKFGIVWNHQDLYQSMLQHSVSSLISDCQEPGLSYPITSVARVINAYSIVFEENICEEQPNCVELLQLCQPKIESLHFLAVGSFDAMKAASYFYNSILSIKCQEAKIATGGCEFLWKHNLLGLGEMILEVEKISSDYCEGISSEVLHPGCASRGHSSSVVLALEAYALKEYKNATKVFSSQSGGSASKGSCQEIEKIIGNMILYAIHSEFQELEEADYCITAIRGIDFQNYNMSCYTALYDDTIIPFLKDVNETQLARELRDLKFDSFMAAFSKCEGNPLSCTNMRYKTPLLKILLEFFPMWIDKMLEHNSLICAVSKEVMLGCDSPFPFFADILKAQFSFAQAMRENFITREN